MPQEDKELLLKDICARIPYGVICHANEINIDGELIFVNKLYNIAALYYDNAIGKFESCPIDDIKPYLRSISSMTEDEKEELLNLLFDKEAKYFYIDEEGFIDGKTSDLMKEGFNYPSFCPINIELYTDFLLSHHFDYRGLIEKKLAIEAPDGMYK